MSARSKRLKERWRAGEVTYGAWLAIGGTAVAEIMANVGFDWVFVETEHAAIDYETLQTTLSAFNGSPTVPIVRVPWNDAVLIKRALDIGAEGIIAPMVKTVEEARTLVSACKYPPEGVRGFGPFRAAGWGRDMVEYARTANDSLIVIPQIEHIDTLPVIDALVRVPGLDAVCLGPADISASAGVLLQIDHPTVQDAMGGVCDAAAAAGLGTCLAIPCPPAVQARWAKRGARLMIAAGDVATLRQALLDRLKAVQDAMRA